MRQRVRRILLLITDLQIGGTPTVVRELAVRLGREGDGGGPRPTLRSDWQGDGGPRPTLRSMGGVAVEVACLAAWGPVADQLRAAGVRVTAFGARGAGDLPRAVKALVRLIREQRIDTVLSFLMHANAVAAIASLACRGARFVQSIQTTQPWPRWHWLVQAAAARAADEIIVPSESVARVARDWSFIPRSKITIIPNAVDVAGFDRSTGVPPVTASGTGGSPVIHLGFIGRLDPVKRIGDAIRAARELGGLVRLDIFGEGAERGRLQQMVSDWSIGHLVTFHGAIDRPQDALAQIDLLILPSEAEGFGLVLIEAMAAGVPIVATRAPGIRDVVRDGQTGLLVPIGSPGDLAQAIRRLMDDSDLRARLVAEAGREVRARFSWEVAMEKYRRLLLAGAIM